MKKIKIIYKQSLSVFMVPASNQKKRSLCGCKPEKIQESSCTTEKQHSQRFVPWTPRVGCKKQCFSKTVEVGFNKVHVSAAIPPICTALPPAPWHGFPSRLAGKGAPTTTKT